MSSNAPDRMQLTAASMVPYPVMTTINGFSGRGASRFSRSVPSPSGRRTSTNIRSNESFAIYFSASAIVEQSATDKRLPRSCSSSDRRMMGSSSMTITFSIAMRYLKPYQIKKLPSPPARAPQVISPHNRIEHRRPQCFLGRSSYRTPFCAAHLFSFLQNPLLFSDSLLNFVKLRSILKEDWSWTRRVNRRIASGETPQKFCLQIRVLADLIVQRKNPWKFQ